MSYLFVKGNGIFLSEGSGREKSSTLLKQYNEKGRAGIVLQKARKLGMTIPEIVGRLHVAVEQPMELTEEIPANNSSCGGIDCRECPDGETCRWNAENPANWTDDADVLLDNEGRMILPEGA